MSRVIVVPEVDAELGPVLPTPSVAPLMANLGMMVPGPQPVIVTVLRVLAVSVPGSKTHVPAVPVFEKSADSMPVTASEKVIV